VSDDDAGRIREDIRRARGTIEDAGGEKVLGYRAPTFSIVEKSLWAIEILAQEGFMYVQRVSDKNDLYGMPGAPRFPFRWLCRDGGSLFEISSAHSFVSWAGTCQWLAEVHCGYFPCGTPAGRCAESGSMKAILQSCTHPWEIDPKQPRLSGKLKAKLRHYFNLGRMDRRVRELLRTGRFVPLRIFLENHLALGPLPVQLSPTTS